MQILCFTSGNSLLEIKNKYYYLYKYKEVIMYKIEQEEDIISPQLIFYKDILQENIQKAISLVGVNRL